MYEFYKEHCKHISKESLSIKVFLETFSDLNIGFSLPKQKNEFDKCWAYRNKNLLHEYVKHIQKKDEARREKEKDKSSDCAHVLVMDLQCFVMPIQASSFYYNMKLCVHNFTFYNFKNNNGVCYVWNEAEEDYLHMNLLQ